jgi:hypothetical protein
MRNLIARRVQKDVPIWDMFEVMPGNWDRPIGTLTSFPGEGPMASVRYDENLGWMAHEPTTFSGKTIREVLAKVREHIDSIDALFDERDAMEHFNEVIAPMLAAERRSEAGIRYNDEDYWL